MDGSAIIQSLSRSQPDNHISVDMYTQTTTTTDITADENDPTGGGDGLAAHNRRKQGRPSRIETSIKGVFAVEAAVAVLSFLYSPDTRLRRTGVFVLPPVPRFTTTTSQYGVSRLSAI
ncbi:hypothetical protein TcWFU_000934 [Taenia crassiceps]|uniref:Uncharacterized protein n=1 Tax=Taenia crassiceps TaxID=6207 RepID=A0ABR4Q5H3_9CEST